MTLRLTPMLWTALREGYGARELRADAAAGLTVAIVALPLSMAIAIASGATPAQGLVTAIVGGFVISALGGSRHQIGGPAGAFIVLVAATVAEHGMPGLVRATFLSGLMLAAAGLAGAGRLVRFVPQPVTVGFTAGIAVIIFASQIAAMLGERIAHESPDILHKLPELWTALPTASPAAITVAAGTVALILALRRWQPRLPAMLVAVAAAAALTSATGLPAETVGDRFGALPQGLPAPALPDLDPAAIRAVLPNALAFTLLGAIEALLSAVVADQLTGRRHRPDAELTAQGLANVASALFGGFCATGTIARTATNVRAGAATPLSGMLHALFLLAAMMLAAPLAALIPLASLAGVLAVVAWNMVERHAVAVLARTGGFEAAAAVATFAVTLLHDLIAGIAAGSAIALAGALRHGIRTRVAATKRGASIGITVEGPLTFLAAPHMGDVLDAHARGRRRVLLDLTRASALDTTIAAVLDTAARGLLARGGGLRVTDHAAAERLRALGYPAREDAGGAVVARGGLEPPTP